MGRGAVGRPDHTDRSVSLANAAFTLHDRSDRSDRIATIRSRTHCFQREHPHCARVALRSLRSRSVNAIRAIGLVALRARDRISGIRRSRTGRISIPGYKVRHRIVVRIRVTRVRVKDVKVKAEVRG